MPTSLGASRSFLRGLKSVKLIHLRDICDQIAVHSAHFEGDYSPLKSYHSSARRSSEIREDYTLKRDLAKENWAITKLCKEGRISEARHLFDGMPERDVVSWTALISGYAKCGLVEEARGLFDRVDAERDVVTWTAMLSGYSRARRISEACRLFDEMPSRNVVAWNTMIDAYVRICMIEEVLDLFERMEERNVVSWNIVISGLVNSGRVEEAMALFHQMPEKNVISWTIMVSGMSRIGRIDEARQLFNEMPDPNVVSWNVMIAGYVQNMRLEEGYALFQVMPHKNAHSWNTMITGFIQNNSIDKARSLFIEIPSKNVVSWTTMINGFVQCGEFEEALKFFCLMQRDGRARPNEGTFVSVLSACSNAAALSEGTQVHQVVIKSLYQDSEFLLSSLINMYSKCGELEMARRVFSDGLRSDRDLVSWNAMIAAYAHHGRGWEAINLFLEMEASFYKPDSATFVALISACSHAGLVEEGLHFFEALLRDESIELNEDHCTCIIDLYSRAGRLDEAFDLISKLPYKASSHTLVALLSGCNIHRNRDMGKLIADELLAAKPENSGLHALVSNAYIHGGRWKEAEKVKSKVKKQPGSSWIEVGNKFHVFVAGEGCREESQILQSLLLNLHDEMEKSGTEES